MLKDQIIATSIKLFDENGFTETSIQDIVNEIGVTKGTFYYYFQSKQDLLYMIHHDFIHYILNEQEQLLNDETKNCKEKLDGIIIMLVKQIKNRKHSARIFFREMRNLGDKNLDSILEKRDMFRYNLQKLIQIGIENNEFRKDLRADILAFAILGILNWSYFWYDPSGTVKEDELAMIYRKLVLDGITSE